MGIVNLPDELEEEGKRKKRKGIAGPEAPLSISLPMQRAEAATRKI